MTTWLEIANGDVDQDSPVTQPLMTGLRDNVRAAAEGATGAPVLSAGWHPFDKGDTDSTEVGDVYDFSDDGTVSTITSPTFEDGYEYAFIFDGISSSNASVTAMNILLYRDTTAAYSSAIPVMSGLTSNTELIFGTLQVQLPRVARWMHSTKWIAEGHTIIGSTLTLTSGVDATISTAAKQTVSAARFSFDLGSFDAGTIRMIRRREYISG
ncbi:MAG TPA: hypothetical protein DCG72_06510 [Gammaproteobacteria bacterium]|jgi:hypothetical protein|nr:hypothetical protein [Gammaproteobacteria bacterium]